MGQVTTWVMTEEERLAYIEKHPIKPSGKNKKKKTDSFGTTHTDYKWRPKRATNSHYGTEE